MHSSPVFKPKQKLEENSEIRKYNKKKKAYIA